MNNVFAHPCAELIKCHSEYFDLWFIPEMIDFGDEFIFVLFCVYLSDKIDVWLPYVNIKPVYYQYLIKYCHKQISYWFNNNFDWSNYGVLLLEFALPEARVWFDFSKAINFFSVSQLEEILQYNVEMDILDKKDAVKLHLYLGK